MTHQIVRRFLAEQAPAYKGKKKTDQGNTIYLYDKKHVEKRTKKKVTQVNKLQDAFGDLRKTYRKDLRSKDMDTKLTALAVALMDVTYERVGNTGSAKDGHFGVTTWRRRHFTFKNDGTATVKYVGKSGVSHKKTIKDKGVVKVLKDLCKGKGKEDCALSDGTLFARSAKVNKYLKPFGITAKDIRGFHANRLMKMKLRQLKKELNRSGDANTRRKARKDKFKEALNWVANEVGHQASTLRSQYLSPNLEEDFVEHGRVNERARMKKSHDEITSRVASRYLLETMGFKRTAGRTKTAGEIVHKKDTGPVRRALPKHYDFNEKALEPLAKTVWHMSIGMGHLLSAQGLFNRIKSSSISPDGMIGGRGYIQSVSDLRKVLGEAIEIVSSSVDTIHDEITAPHWKPEKLQLPEDEQDAVDEILEEAEEILAAPKEKAEEEYQEEMADKVEKKQEKADEDEADDKKSELPTDNGEQDESEASEYDTPEQMRGASVKEASMDPHENRVDLDTARKSLPQPAVESLGRPNSWEDDHAEDWQVADRPALNSPPQYEWGVNVAPTNLDGRRNAVRKAMKR
jgi:DNA topoisomerase IB